MSVDGRPVQRGFALLEAIVALAILAAAGLALFAALTQSMQMVNRADAARAQAQSVRNVIAAVETLNPMERPAGSMSLGTDVELAWTSRLMEPVQPSATGTLNPGLYDIGLYELDCRLIERGREVQRFTVRRTGYVQARQLPRIE